ncbi:MAG: DNA mismatch repair protein MutS [Defluviitaleaceae bacterium]|nr:DNA mismatch repair protein MutS [Defluviitaleaceae bacterium]
MRDKFQVLVDKHEAVIEQKNRVFNTLGYVRLVLLVAMIFLGIFMFTMGFPVGLIGAFVGTAFASGILWFIHSEMHSKLNFHKGIVKICNRQLARISGEWTNFTDNGGTLADAAHFYARDLDIVGPKSLFQLLNTTHTWFGRKAFSRDLLAPPHNAEEIKKRQAAIEELSGDVEFTSQMQYHLSQIGVNALDEKLQKQLSNASIFFHNTAAKFLLTYMPVPTILLIAAGVIFAIQPLWTAGAMLIAAQMLVWGVSWRHIAGYFGLMGNMPYKLGKYAAAINAITARKFSCEKLLEIQAQLNEASAAVNELEKIGDRIDIKHNALLYLALNAVLLWDFHCAFLLENWKKKHAAQTDKWFTAIAEFESLQSFSHLPNVCTHTCLPEIQAKKPLYQIIDATGIGHPLILNESRVNNDLSFNNNIFIISGSNMSGKTTFMRTVGINLILARAGSFVCAEKMTCAPFDVVTSMRISDDLNEGISTFYAELKRIKLIIDAASENPNMLFLIDEIFKGTNSIDRLAGAEAVISRLNEMGCAGMLSTHDLELCRLAGTGVSRIQNHSFSEFYQNNGIHFDYKIKPGQSQTTNAKYLMQMVGLTCASAQQEDFSFF